VIIFNKRNQLQEEVIKMTREEGLLFLGLLSESIEENERLEREEEEEEERLKNEEEERRLREEEWEERRNHRWKHDKAVDDIPF